VTDSSTAGSAVASPATATATSTAAATADAATGTVDAAIHTAAAMGTAAAIDTANCPATGLLATAATEADKLDHDILDAMIKLFRQILAQSEELAERYGVPLFCVKALHILDTSMAMKELGQRMGCDPSFVTAIADTLEKRGLARREASAADRRVKNLVLSSVGIELKGQIETEMLASMPWSRALDTAERESFLSLVRKLVDAGATSQADAGFATPASTGTAVPDAKASSPATPTEGGRAGEVSDALDTASAGN
jgi:DNA-binding MarR family transcriptional regulator